MRIRLIVLVFLIGLFLMGFVSAYTFSSGDGTLANPWTIYNWTDLNATKLDLTGNYSLMANLSASDGDYSGLGDNWVPIGEFPIGFTGSFDGQNNTISDIIISLSGDNVGLFGVITGASISNLGLVNVDVDGAGLDIAPLVGYVSSGTITNCYATGTVDNAAGFNEAGGLVGGHASGIITNSYSTASVTVVKTDPAGGGWYAGGITGYSYGTISNCYATGSITGNEKIGGLIGNFGGTLTNSYSTGSVTGNNDVGGLFGYDSGATVTASFWDTETSGLEVGIGGEDASQEGVTGKTTAQMKKLYTFNSPYANWNINGGESDLNDGYPYLAWQAGSGDYDWMIPDATSLFAGGDGSSLTPYQINSWVGLDAMRYDLDAYYVLSASLSSSDGDYSGIGDSWVPVGSESFSF